VRVSLLALLLLIAAAVAWPVGAGAQAKVCVGHPTDPSVVCAPPPPTEAGAHAHPHAHPGAPPPVPPQIGSVQLGVGLECAPRGTRMSVSLTVHKRKVHAKPRVKARRLLLPQGEQRAARRRPLGPQQALPPDASDPPRARPRTTSTPAPTTRARARRSCAATVVRRVTVCA
jgi:hypothetical protein